MAPEDRYQPLLGAPGCSCIRLLTLQPGRSDDQIVCQLQVADLSDCNTQEKVVRYDALSYAFGPDQPTHEVTLGAWPVDVRENLWLGMCQIRHLTEPISLWIDALCINLLDLDERASQVQLMDQIYQRARRVLVWLGPADDNSAAAIRMIKEAAAKDSGRIQRTEREYRALMAWSERAYWNRTWVVQEFLLARDVVLICGADYLEWPTLERFLRRIERESEQPSPGHPLSDWSSFLRQPAFRLMQQRVRLENPGAPLATLLIQNRDTECHNPRDKVYAMLGLATDLEPGRGIRVSYTKDTRLLLFDIIRHCQVPAKHVLRWTRFLTDMLKIEREKIRAIPRLGVQEEPSFSQGHGWTVTGFTTGEVVSLGSLNGLFDHMSKDLAHLSRSQALTEDEHQKIYEMLKELKNDDVDRLRASFDSLNAAGRCSVQGRYGDARAMFAVVYMSAYTTKQVLAGVAFGNLDKGDVVLQFLGNEVAIVTNTEAQSSRITGCLLFPRPRSAVPGQKTRDIVTQFPYQSHIVQSEAECIESVKQINWQMGPAEILALAQ